MKKSLVFFVCIVLCVVLCIVIAVVAVNKSGNKNKEKIVVSTENVEPLENTVETITVTAAGDCTLGTDVKFGVGADFPSEVERQKKDYSHFLKNVAPFFENDDLTIVNFEGTLTNRNTREPKLFAFKGDPEYVKVLTTSSVEAANVANNHSRDYGELSLEDTKKYLIEAGVTTFGIDEIAIVDIKGIKVGLIGTNPMNHEVFMQYPEMFRKLKKQNPDLIIANFHWGAENAGIADLSQVDIAHQAIDNGADLVIGHHPHVLQGIEKYKDRYIVYSLGNFCFGGNSNPVDKDTMIFQQTFSFKNGKLDVSYDDVSVIPCSISSVVTHNNYQPTPLYGAEFTRVKNKILSRSRGYEGTENIKFIYKPHKQFKPQLNFKINFLTVPKSV